jgi:multidrug efflux pump subunit AcrA (membrane-fusion protein)
MLEQKQKLYALKKAQLRAEIANLKLTVSTQRRVVDDLDAILAAFTITAPADGMVIYKKDRLGQKIVTGANVNPWDPVVATLPDLSSMLSKVFISEIDINKVQEDMHVEITIDAFQNKYFTGKIHSIANIGEQLTNSDSKVFEVLVKVEDFDPALRPSMTTSNRVIVKTFDDVTFVPTESVHAGIDSVPYVYTKGNTKQIVVLGESNDKNIIVEQGLKPGTPVWLSIPENPEKFTLAGTELIPVIREKEREMARLERERISMYNDELSIVTGDDGSSGSSSGSAGSN